MSQSDFSLWTQWLTCAAGRMIWAVAIFTSCLPVAGAIAQDRTWIVAIGPNQEDQDGLLARVAT